MNYVSYKSYAKNPLKKKYLTNVQLMNNENVHLHGTARNPIYLVS